MTFTEYYFLTSHLLCTSRPENAINTKTETQARDKWDDIAMMNTVYDS